MISDPVLLIGPSGSGKSALAERLIQRGTIAVTPTITTRPRRADEDRGSSNHRFVDDATFDRLEQAGAFLGVVRLAGLPHRYGLPPVEPPADGEVPAIVARAPFVAAVRAVFPSALAYQIERPAGSVLRALCERGTSTEEVLTRLRAAESERRAGRALATRCFMNDGSLDALEVAVVDALMADRDLVAGRYRSRPRSGISGERWSSPADVSAGAMAA